METLGVQSITLKKKSYFYFIFKFQNCGTFSPTWKTSFDTAVTLFNQLETTDHVKTDFKTFVKIGEQVLELLYEKKEVYKKEFSFCRKLKFLIPFYFQPDGANL